MCKRGNMFSLTVLIGRGFVLCVHYFGSAYYLFSFLCAFLIFLDLLLANPFLFPSFLSSHFTHSFFPIFLAPYSGAFICFNSIIRFCKINFLSIFVLFSCISALSKTSSDFFMVSAENVWHLLQAFFTLNSLFL